MRRCKDTLDILIADLRAGSCTMASFNRHVLPTLFSLSFWSLSCLGQTLRYAPPESVGLLPEPLRLMEKNISDYTRSANYLYYTNYEEHPIQPGGSVVVGHDSAIVSEFAFGKAMLYADANGTLLPEDEQTTAFIDTIYDMASLTKVFTATAALRLIEDGLLDYKKTVASYMPEFAANGKENVTVLMLLTHTSGFPPDPEPGLWYNATLEERRETAIRYPLANAPGTTYTYSDLNFINTGFLLEKISGVPLDLLIYSITAPLGMTSTFYNRGDVEGPLFPFYPRIAPTEYELEVQGQGPVEPQRPQPVHGTVHDENAWSLAGVSGHAGLFSTAPDLAKFCQMILNNGTYNGIQILKPETIELMFTNFNVDFPGDEHSIGFELNQYYFSGPMASMQTGGHTGFTGTTIVIDRPSNTFFVLLGHRVHPNRNWSNNNIARQALGYWVARSLGRDVTFPEL
ncbi:hypothetical protein MAP00_006480 [Monascus purpureus]|nr:hypothetical protein MAP00_006480 [Monascus purpureus]